MSFIHTFDCCLNLAHHTVLGFRATLFVDVKLSSTCLKLKLLQEHNISFAEFFCLDFISVKNGLLAIHKRNGNILGGEGGIKITKKIPTSFMDGSFLDVFNWLQAQISPMYRVFKLDMIYFKHLLGHQKCTFTS